MSSVAGLGVTMRTRFRFYANSPYVLRRIDGKVLKVITRAGAFGRRVMKNKYRRPFTGQRNRTVTMNGRQFFVPPFGQVIDLSTGRGARTTEANAARVLLAAKPKAKSAGLPPRRGPTDKLYKFTDFAIDVQNKSAVIGPVPFAEQPAMVGRVSVPELLDKGGGEYIGGQLVQYDAYPFTQPSFEPTFNKMAELLETVPL